MERIELRTPLYKEILLAVLFLIFAGMGAALIKIGLEGEPWYLILIGVILVGFCVPALIVEATSRRVLVADSEGLTVHAHYFARRRRVPWRDVAGFEKMKQTLPKRGLLPPPEYTYLVIKMKQPEEHAGATEAILTHAFSNAVITDKPFIAGNIHVSSLRLPGKVDELVAQLEAYRVQVTAALLPNGVARPGLALAKRRSTL